MEADWEFDVGGDAPTIEVLWTGFVDLRKHPERAREFSESLLLPELADALVRLNASGSPVWTSKTDVFDPGLVDADELDAATDETAHALACYIDLLPSIGEQWSTPFEMERDCKRICARLATRPLRCSRVDLVIRRTHTLPRSTALGVTAYLIACGRAAVDARSRLAECLAVFAEVITQSQHRLWPERETSPS